MPVVSLGRIPRLVQSHVAARFTVMTGAGHDADRSPVYSILSR